MNTFLESRYYEAQRRYLDQCAYMHETNLKHAEQRGGVEALTGADKTRFEGIQGRLVDLVAFNDAAGDYIASLESMINDILLEKKQLRARLTQATGEHPLPPPVPYREYLGMMVLATKIPKRLASLLDSREGRRQAIRNTLIMEMPQLF